MRTEYSNVPKPMPEQSELDKVPFPRLRKSKKLAWYTLLDECNFDYLKLNKSIVDVDKNFPLYVVSSVVSEDEVRYFLPNAIVIEVSENNVLKKFNALLDVVEGTEAEVLVKIDLDAIVFDLGKVAKMASSVQEGQHAGNLRVVRGIEYVRGGCSACHLSALSGFRIEVDGAYPGLDITLGEQLDCERVDLPMFEISPVYTGKAPVWHPPKSNKLDHFKSQIDALSMPISSLSTQSKLESCIALCYKSAGGEGDFDKHYAAYVTRLVEGINKHTTDNPDVVLLTDGDFDRVGLPSNVRVVPFVEDFPLWHCRNCLFYPGVFGGYDRVLYIDLDTVINGNLDGFLNNEDDFAVIRDLGIQGKWQYGIFSFNPKLEWIQDGSMYQFLRAQKVQPQQSHASLINKFLEKKGVTPTFLQDKFSICSYKIDLKRKGLNADDYQVVCFHGNPRPHEVNWNIEIDKKKVVRKRNVPVKVNPEWQGEDVFLIGGGPSLKGVDLNKFLDEYKVIGVNDGYLFECADACFFGDQAWYCHHKEALHKLEMPIYSTSSVIDDKIHHLDLKPAGMSEKKNTVGWNSCSGWAALNLALHLGAKRVFLLGYDMQIGKDGSTNWHPNIRKVRPSAHRVHMQNQRKIYDDLNEFWPESEVYNVIIDGFDSALEVFKKVKFSELFCVDTKQIYMNEEGK